RRWGAASSTWRERPPTRAGCGSWASWRPDHLRPRRLCPPAPLRGDPGDGARAEPQAWDAGAGGRARGARGPAAGGARARAHRRAGTLGSLERLRCLRPRPTRAVLPAGGGGPEPRIAAHRRPAAGAAPRTGGRLGAPGRVDGSEPVPQELAPRGLRVLLR